MAASTIPLLTPGETDAIRGRIDLVLEHLMWPDRYLAQLMGPPWDRYSNTQLHALFHPGKDAAKRMEFSFVCAVAQSGFGIEIDEFFGKEPSELLRVVTAAPLYDGKSEESLRLAALFNEHEQSVRSEGGELMVYSPMPAPSVLTNAVQECSLTEATAKHPNGWGFKAYVKDLGNYYSLRRRRFMKDGYGKAECICLADLGRFERILHGRGEYGSLSQERRSEWLDYLQYECIEARDLRLGLVVKQKVPNDLAAWLTTRDSIATVGENLAITALNMEDLPLRVKASVKRAKVDAIAKTLTSLRNPSYLLFDPSDPRSVAAAFDDFRRQIDNSPGSAPN